MSLYPVIEAVALEKVAAGEMFTAHDVTLEVRKRGHKASHTDVKDAVHDVYGRGLLLGYSRSTISVPGGNPFLYHSQNDDPNTYSNIRGQNPAATSANSVSSQNNQTINIPSSISSLGSSVVAGATASNKNHSYNTRTTKNSPGSTKNRTVDGRGTLSIPSQIIRGLGFKPSDKVYAFSWLSNSVVVSDKLPQNVSVYGKYTVDNHNQVRVTQALLTRAGIAGKEYDLTANNNEVVIQLS